MPRDFYFENAESLYEAKDRDREASEKELNKHGDFGSKNRDEATIGVLTSCSIRA